MIVKFFLTFSLLGQSFGRDLFVVESNTKLPFPCLEAPAVYDGQDSIYILSGTSGPTNIRQGLVKYSLSNDTATLITTTTNIWGGSATWAGNQGIFYFGGIDNDNITDLSDIRLLILTPPTSSFKTVANFSTNTTFSAAVSDGVGKTYVFGGSQTAISSVSNKVLEFSESDYTLKEVADLPTGGTTMASAVWDNINNVSYIFGGYSSNAGRVVEDILKYDPLIGKVEKLSLSLPIPISHSCAVWARTDAYLIGGVTTSTTNKTGIIRVNPGRTEAEFVNVANFTYGSWGMGCSYVEKLNRIYIFGGWEPDRYRANSIMYIDLDDKTTTSTAATTLAPSTTTSTTSIAAVTSTTTRSTTMLPTSESMTCSGKTDGTLVANPFNCNSFYMCLKQKPNLLYCPYNLQFNPTTLRCGFSNTCSLG